MNFGIFGGGMIARFHGEAIRKMKDSKLVAVYARRQEVAEELAQELGCQAYWDEEAFLAHPDLDIVTIASPSGAHLEPTLKAAAAGKHVICEKPLEITPERVDTMTKACEAAGVTLSGIFNRRFNPAVTAFKAAVERSRFGHLALAGASVRWYRDPAYYNSSNWKGTWQLDGGGALMNQSIHAIDQLLFIVGPVKRVSAFTTRATHKSIEVEDTGVAILEFENGARGIIEGSTASWSASGNPAEVYAHGDCGSVVLADDGFRQWEFKDSTPSDQEVLDKLMRNSEGGGLGANDPSAINADGHTRNFEDVVNSIQQKTPLAVDGHEARKAVALICAIYESAKNNGQPVNI